MHRTHDHPLERTYSAGAPHLGQGTSGGVLIGRPRLSGSKSRYRVVVFPRFVSLLVRIVALTLMLLSVRPSWRRASIGHEVTDQVGIVAKNGVQAVRHAENLMLGQV